MKNAAEKVTQAKPDQSVPPAWDAMKDSVRAKEPVLVALGITADGHKEILDILHAPSESAEAWSTLLTRLKMRGLKPEQLSLVLTDGDAGLISALAATLQSVPRQRCTVSTPPLAGAAVDQRPRTDQSGAALKAPRGRCHKRRTRCHAARSRRRPLRER